MRVPSPRVLLIASLVVAGATVALGVLLVHPRRVSPTPAPTHPTRTHPAPAETAPPPAAFAIVGPTVRVDAYGATLTWSTPTPATGSVRWGPTGMEPLLWSAVQPASSSQRVELRGLAAATRYTATIGAVAADGRTARLEVTFESAPAPVAPVGTVGDGVMRIDGAPVFPLLAWEECPDRWRPDLADGIDLFGGNPCTGLPNLLAAVQGRALVAGTTDDLAGTAGPAPVGWFYPDEADARGYTGETLPRTAAGLRFLTLTSHFAAGTATLPQGRSVYPGLIARADVVGFDLYPLQELCRPELLPAVFDAQQQLIRLAWPRPTFQWIEEREMKCPQPASAVTPATIRVESWLAVAGGAHGLAFFPPDWHAPTGSVIRGIARRVRQLEPALLRPAASVQVDGSTAVRASARTLNDALYVIAVNAGTAPAPVTLTAPALGDRSFGNAVHASAGALRVVLPPRSVRFLVSPPLR